MKEISSLQHPRVLYWTKLSRDAAFRKEQSRVLLEGKNGIRDLSHTIGIKRLIVNDPNLAAGLKADEVYVTSDAIIRKISTVVKPEGMIAEFEIPPQATFNRVSRLVALDRIQDPGNLGTLIRSALAFGWEGIFLLPGCVDPFNDKALRAAKGATFSLPIGYGEWNELQKIAKSSHAELLVADMEGEAQASVTAKKMVLVLGNEAQGVSIPDSTEHRRVTLPMKGPIESLNVAVAGSILMYLFQETHL